MLPPRRTEHWFRDRSQVDTAARLAFSLARHGAKAGDATVVRPFFRTARRLLRHKSSFDAHDLKAPIAFFENVQCISPEWRPHLIAASVHNLHGTQMDDNPIVAEARAALQNL